MDYCAFALFALGNGLLHELQHPVPSFQRKAKHERKKQFKLRKDVLSSYAQTWNTKNYKKWVAIALIRGLCRTCPMDGECRKSQPFCALLFWHPAPSMAVASYSMGKYTDHLAGRQGINSVFHDSKPVSTQPEKDCKPEP